MQPMQIRVAEPVLNGNEAKYVLECIQDTWISSRGKYIDRFEQMLADYCDVGHAVVTNNGTSALHLALAGCGIGAGDEVILPTLSYVASGNAVRYCNASPVFVDSEHNYLNIDVRRIERAISARTKAILTVPLYGHPVDMDPITEIADRHGLMVIEDSAEALGARYHGRAVGSLAKCSTFSFFGNKLITTGEGGAITTDDAELAERLRFLRGQGVDAKRRYWHPEIGFNFRMTNVAAALGVAQMERIDGLLARRKQVARWYFERLVDRQDLLQLPHAAEWAEHSYWMFTVLLQKDVDVDRDTWMDSLAQAHIETRPVFYPIHWMPAYRQYAGHFPVADDCSSRGVNLPTHANLTESDVDYICEQVLGCIERLRGTRKSATRRAASMSLPLVIFGAGGHAKMAIEAARSGSEFQPLLCLAAGKQDTSSSLLGVKVASETDAEIRRALQHSPWAFVAVGNNELRQRLSGKLTALGFSMATLVAANAWVSPSARVGAGSILMPNAVLGADAEIGCGVIVNTSATVDHDCVVDSYAHLAPGVHLAGNVHVGHLAFVGIGANVVPQKSIGAGAMIGAGAVVVSDIPAAETWVGCPARRLNSRAHAA